MLSRLFLLFVLLPLADLALLLYLATKIGWQTSLGLVLVSGFAAAWLVRRSYREVFRRLQQQTAQGEFSLVLLSDGAMIFLGAGLLLTPGFISDALGLSLLIPACRRWYRARLAAWIKKNVDVKIVHGFPDSASRSGDSDDFLDGEIVKSGPESRTRTEHSSPATANRLQKFADEKTSQ